MQGQIARVAGIALLAGMLVAGDCDDDDDDFFFFFPASGPPADLNLDGFADVVVGAPLDDGAGTSGSERGAVFVYLGSASGPSATPDLTIFGAEDCAHFGASLALVGDVNGLGAPDLLVGAPLDDGDGNADENDLDRGRAFVYFGGPSMDAIPDVTITGTEAGGELGASVARAGDSNRDGIDDWLVGAPFDDGDGNATDEATDRGRAFFFYGRPTPSNLPDLTLTGTENDARFGFAVASAGDLNGGGAEDIAVGAPRDDGDDDATDQGTDRGRVYVFYGGSALDATPDLVLTGDEDDAQLGAAIAPVFDVSNDGVDDLLVGAPLHDAGASGSDRGAAYLYFGGLPPDTTSDLTLLGTVSNGAFGASVSRAGDADGDGQRDFLVGAPLENPGARTDAGAAYLFRGGNVLDATPDLVLAGEETGAEFGSVVAAPGDIDGHGRDLLVGAPFDDADGNATDDDDDRGSVFVYAGGAALDAIPDAILDGAQDGALAASAIGN